MPFFTRKKPWTKKPHRKIKVDHTNPLARGLVGCWIDGLDTFRGELEDLSKSKNNAVSESSTVVTPGVDAQGRMSVITNATSTGTGYGYDLGDPSELSAIDTEITIIQGVVLRDDPGMTNWGRGISKTDGGTGDNWGTVFRASSAPNNREIYLRINGTQHGGTQLNAEQYYNLAFQYKSGDKKIWIDGVIDLDTGVQGGSITTTGNVKIGNHGSADSRALRGDLHYTYVFDRFLSPQEIKAFHENPYQFLEGQTEYLPTPSVVAATTAIVPFKKIWDKKPPNHNSRLNLSDPIVKGLTVALIYNEGGGETLHNLAHGFPNAVFDTDAADKPTWSVNPSTRHVSVLHNSSMLNIPSIDATNGSKSFTIATHVQLENITSNDSRVLVLGTEAGYLFRLDFNKVSSNGTPRFRINTGTVGSPVVRTVTSSPNWGTTGDGDAGILICTCEYNGTSTTITIECYMEDGSYSTSSNTYSGESITPITEQLTFANSESGASTQIDWRGHHDYSFIWSRALAPAERKAFAKNAWRVIDPRTIYLPISIPAAVGGAQTAALLAALDCTDVFSAVVTAAASITEGVNLADTESATAAASASITEAMSAGDSDGGSAAAIAALTNNTNLTDTESALAAAVAALNAGLDAGETWAASAAALASLTEAVNLGDSYVGATVGAQTGALAETTDYSEAFDAAVAALASLSEGVTLDELIAATAAASASVSANASLGATFSAVALSALAGALVAGTTNSDAFVAAVSALANLSEGVDLGDTMVATTVASASIAASVNFGASFSYAGTIGCLIATITLAAALSASTTLDTAVDGDITICP